MIYSTNISQVLGQFFSIDSCLAQLADFVLTVMDKGMYTGMIVIDLRS